MRKTNTHLFHILEPCVCAHTHEKCTVRSVRSESVRATRSVCTQWGDSTVGSANTSWILTTRRYSQTSCWSNKLCCSRSSSRRKFILLARRSEQNSAWTNIWKMVGGGGYYCQRPHGGYQYWYLHFSGKCKSRQRRPLDTVDLREPPDSCERTGAPRAVGFLVKVKPMSGNCALKISYLTAILGRHGLMDAAPADLKKKAECFSPQLLQGFWSMLKTKDVVMVQLSSLNTLTKKKSYGNIIVCSWPWQSIRSSAVSIFFFWDPNHERFGGWRRYNTFRKSSIASGTLLRGKNPSGCFIIFAISYNHLSFVPASRERVVPTNWQVRAISWRPYVQGKSDFNSSATVSAICADQGLPGSWKFEHTKGSNIGHELDQGPTWRVETSDSSADHYYRPSNTQLSKEYDCKCSARSWKMRVIGLT